MRTGTLVKHCIAASVLALFGVSVYADNGKPRYVSGAGRDAGDCLNKFRPCRSLSYAIARAGKGDSVHVAEGEYSVQTAQQLADLLTVNGRINAGYNKYTGFTDRNAKSKTLLIGVPATLRERFEASGFSVIADTKSLFAGSDTTRAESQQMQKLASQITASEKNHAAAPCVANVSAGFPCQSVSLLSHMSLQQLQPVSARGADLWGFTDLNTGREYVIMGLQSGVAVVDITNPTAPEQVSYATGSSTIWREVTIYQHYDQATKRWRAYAYITADGISEHLMILDLSALPNGVERVNFASDFTSAHTDFMVNADYSFGIAANNVTAQLAISGAGVNGGNYRLYSLAQPRAPQLLSVGTAGYAHDVAAFAVADARKDTQCINAAGAAKCQVLTDFNEGTIDVWDVTNPSSVRLLGRQSYANAAYVHSGWWTEDGRYLFAHDELDEQNFGLNTTVRVFDMSNLAIPNLVGSWVGPTRAIDHNGYARGNRYYFANYSEGLTVLDVTNPIAPQRVGFFDTYPSSSQMGFVAAWGTYPFFPSGTVAVGDINSGLYLLKNETLNVAQGTLALTTASAAGQEGQTVTLAVSRTGGSTGAVSVQLDLLHASTDASDVTIGSQLISWADGDTLTKSVAVNLLTDALDENLELLLVRLQNPQGGATINYPDTAHVRIADVGATTRLRLVEQTLNVDELRAKALVTVSRQESLTGQTRVSFRTLPNATYSGFTAQQGELIWADGEADAKTVSIVLDPTRLSAGQTAAFQVEFFGTTNADLEASNGSTAAAIIATVTVTDNTPQPAPPPSARGGGRIQLYWLAVLVLLLSWRGFAAHRRRT